MELLAQSYQDCLYNFLLRSTHWEAILTFKTQFWVFSGSLSGLESSKMSIRPAVDPPPGEQSDWGHPNILFQYNVVAQTVCMVVAGTLFFLRCYVRLGFSRMPKQWILEDCECFHLLGCRAWI